MKHLQKFEAYSNGIVAAAPADIFLHYYTCPTCTNAAAIMIPMPEEHKCHPEMHEVSKNEFFNFLYKNNPDKKGQVDQMKDKIENDIIPLQNLPQNYVRGDN